MYSSVLPSVDDKDEKKEETLNADDPANRDKLRAIIRGDIV